MYMWLCLRWWSHNFILHTLCYVIFMLSIVTPSLPPFLFLSVLMFKHSFKDKKQKKLRKKQKTIGASFRNMYVFLSLSPHILLLVYLLLVVIYSHWVCWSTVSVISWRWSSRWGCWRRKLNV